jgi:hypothetical protein
MIIEEWFLFLLVLVSALLLLIALVIHIEYIRPTRIIKELAFELGLLTEKGKFWSSRIEAFGNYRNKYLRLIYSYGSPAPSTASRYYIGGIRIELFHKRNLNNPIKIVKRAIRLGFDVKYEKTEYNLVKYLIDQPTMAKIKTLKPEEICIESERIIFARIGTLIRKVYLRDAIELLTTIAEKMEYRPPN